MTPASSIRGIGDRGSGRHRLREVQAPWVGLRRPAPLIRPSPTRPEAPIPADPGRGRDPLSQALAMAGRGYRVFPVHGVRPDGTCACRRGPDCASPGKHPCVRGWQKLATADPGRIAGFWRAWPDANPGIAPGPDTVVVDIDGPAGLEAYLGHAGLTALPGDTLVVRSGGGAPGKVHVFHSLPEGVLNQKRQAQLGRGEPPRRDRHQDGRRLRRRPRRYPPERPALHGPHLGPGPAFACTAEPARSAGQEGRLLALVRPLGPLDRPEAGRGPEAPPEPREGHRRAGRPQTGRPPPPPDDRAVRPHRPGPAGRPGLPLGRPPPWDGGVPCGRASRRPRMARPFPRAGPHLHPPRGLLRRPGRAGRPHAHAGGGGRVHDHQRTGPRRACPGPGTHLLAGPPPRLPPPFPTPTPGSRSGRTREPYWGRRNSRPGLSYSSVPDSPFPATGAGEAKTL